jgi:hypothetical protein
MARKGTPAAAVLANGISRHAFTDAQPEPGFADEEIAERIATWLESDRWANGTDIAAAIRRGEWKERR